MTMNAVDKIVEGLTRLLEGFSELEDALESDFGAGVASNDEEFSVAIISEIRAAVETCIESEEYTPEYIASLVSAFVGALEELDPDIFGDENEDEESEEDYSDDDDPYSYDD